MTRFNADRCVAVVTGGGSGIGAALSRRLASAGARVVVVVDRDAESAQRVAAEVADTGADGVAESVDVSDQGAVVALVDRTLGRFGQIDLFCSNAGVFTGVELDTPVDAWRTAFAVNLMSHVYAAGAVLPSMLERGSGWLLNTASAAGLLISPSDAPYTATKHAAVGFAEYLSVMYGSRGIGVSLLCPLGVATPLLLDPLAMDHANAQAVAASGEIISPDSVAEVALSGMAEGRFLLLPHPEVAEMWRRKAAEPERWLARMRGLVGRF